MNLKESERNVKQNMQRSSKQVHEIYSKFQEVVCFWFKNVSVVLSSVRL